MVGEVPDDFDVVAKEAEVGVILEEGVFSVIVCLLVPLDFLGFS